MSIADALIASADRPIELRMRRDLKTAQQHYQGHRYVVVKEPLGLKYFRFREEEMAILEALDGNRSLNQIKREFEKRFAPQSVDLRELQQFVGRLHKDNLVVSAATGQGEQLQKRAGENRRRKVKQALLSVLAIRFPGVDPERLLSTLLPWCRWIYHPVTVSLSVLLMVSALLLVAIQYATFAARLPTFHEFFGPQNWLLLACVMASVKIIHEIGHGLTCKYFGGECHEIGLMLLVFTPCLYCDVSDSWMLNSKWRRMAIGGAGIYVELLLAAIATFIWWFSAPATLVNQLALQVMFICSLSTVIFNGNPLLRYDGYYIFADWVEIPNLRQKASQILQRGFTQYCLGIETPADPFLPPKRRFLLGLYTVASFCYRWVVLVSIMFFLNTVLEPYDLMIVGQLVMLVGGVSMVAMPLWQMGKFLAVPGRLDKLKWRNVAISLAVVAAVVAAVCLIPLPHRVHAPFEIRPADAAQVKSETPGQLAEVFVEAGSVVEPGDRLARLVNHDLETQIEQLKQQQQEISSQLEAKRRERFSDPAAAADLPELTRQLQSVEDQLHQRRQQQARLTLYAPRAGVVLDPPIRATPPTTDDARESWTGSPLDPDNKAIYLTSDDLLCEIGDPSQLEAWIIVDQADVRFVAQNDQVELQINAFVDQPLRSQIETISREPIDKTPSGMDRQAGGEVASQTDSTGNLIPLNPSYQATAPIPDSNLNPRPGLRGTAKIHVGQQTLGQRAWRYLWRTFRFEL